MKGLPVLNKWIGAFGDYEIPAAIIWLADEANRVAKKPKTEAMNVASTGIESFKQYIDSPGYKVVEEWGVWRDEEEASAWAHKHG